MASAITPTAGEPWREEQRQALIRRRLELTETSFTELSRQVLRQIEQALAGRWARRFGLYWPCRHEIALFPLVRRIMEAGGVPAVRAPSAAGPAMQFRTWTPGDPLATAGARLPFPRDGALVAPDVIFVPLVGFDAANFRLGYGGGSYRRALARTPRPTSIGVGLELMRMETVHPAPDDLPLDVVVTERGAFGAPDR